MRPLFGVVLVPSIPMNDERLSTSGSFRMTCASCLLAFRQGSEGDVLRRFRNAQNHARILHREKSLRHDHVQEQRQHQSTDRDQQGRGLVLQHQFQVRP